MWLSRLSQVESIQVVWGYKGRAGPWPSKFRGSQTYNMGCLPAFMLLLTSQLGEGLGMGSLLTEDSDGDTWVGHAWEGQGHRNG